ncbi:SDR family NAD(P)-dependent oxidoreductase [Streptomyces sp. NPDC054932]
MPWNNAPRFFFPSGPREQAPASDGRTFVRNAGRAEAAYARDDRASSPEPIAIIGIGCRLPGGANDPTSFWKLLREGVDAITEVPAERWDLRAFYDPDVDAWGMTRHRFGGFIDGIDHFDPEFFGISLREAAAIDPQQRLLLELAWEALEDGGQVLDVARGSNAGVFVGCSTNDYLSLQGSLQDRALLDLHITMGSALSISANRISFCLNLRGPSVALDTACSSSLTAIHLACRSLRDGECTVALAGGVNAILTPRNYISLKSASMLSLDGRCKAFDSRADGFVRAEGAGMLLLKPLSAALADGNPIYAVIRGSATNQDGRTVGITVPSQEAQQALVSAACRAAGVSPSEVYYVEAHGPGTPVGDPVEAHALSAALCGERSEADSLVVGSVKTNIGHLEAGAGVAGIIKVALMLQHGNVPPNLHFLEPNPRIDFQKLKVRVPQTLEPLPAGRVVIGINSFGFGGSNAHAVLESPPAEVRTGGDRSPGTDTVILPLSSRSEEVLPDVASRYAAFLRGQGGHDRAWLRDVCYTAGVHRGHHEHRLAVSGQSVEELAAALEAFAGGGDPPQAAAAHVEQQRKPAFVFCGQGAQWWAMGRQLLAHEPVFRQKVEECDRLFRRWGSWSVLEELAADEQNSRLQETAIAQPAIFAIQVGLAALWSSWGIEPDAVVGHSVGEVAAAHVSGALDLEEAARVIFHRGRCMSSAPTTGRMLAAGLTAEEALSLIAPYGERVSLAAINSPSSVTLSGEEEPLREIEASLGERGVFCRFLSVQYAFHSAQMQPVESELSASLGDVAFTAPRIPMYSTVTAAPVDGEPLDAAYWWRNVRQTVHFADAVDGLLRDGFNAFLELGPHPVLSSSVSEAAARRSLQPAVLSSLKRGENENTTMRRALGGLYTRGYAVDWRALFPAGGRCVRLPVYPWKHRRYWQESDENNQDRLETFVHPLLGRRVRSANPYWENKIEGRLRTQLAEHRVQGNIVFPAAAYVEMLVAGATQLLNSESCALEDIEIHKPLFVPDSGEGPSLQLAYSPVERSLQISSRTGDWQSAWNLHCSARLGPDPVAVSASESPEHILERCREEIPASDIYRELTDLGFGYGPHFRGIREAWRGEGEALGRVAPPPLSDDAKYLLPPGILDSCFQMVLAAALPTAVTSTTVLYLPARVGRVHLYRRPERDLWCHARVKRADRSMLDVDLSLLNPDGQVAVEVESFVCQAVEGARRPGSRSLEDAVYEFEWQLQPLSPSAAQDAPDFWPDLPALAGDLQQGVSLSALAGDQTKFVRLQREVDRLCAAYVVRALEQLGCSLREGEFVPAQTLQARVAPQHHALLRRYVTMLEEDGVLREADGGWTVIGGPEREDADRLWRDIYGRLPSYLPEASLLRRSGERLADILSGRTDPVEVLFGGNSFIEQFFSDSVSYRSSYRSVRAVLDAVVEGLPEGRKLRILEVGAGTGGLTSCVLPALGLPAEQVEYVFTDLTTHFLSRAEQRFQHFPGMRYQTLDLERSPAGQGFDEHSFDLVLAANVLHATSDVRRSLAHVKQLLASDGMLLMVEIDHPSRWVDLVFAPTEGWWKFADNDLRPDYPLLSGDRWLEVLGEEGFADGAKVTDVGGLRDTQHVVLVGRGPALPEPAPPVSVPSADAAANWLVFADRHGVAQRLVGRLEGLGGSCVTVGAGTAYRETGDGHFEVEPAAKDDMKRLLDAVTARRGPLDGIVFLWSVEPSATEPSAAGEPSLAEVESAQTEGCHSVLALTQALAECDRIPELWLVTRGTQPAGRERPMTIRHSSVWGLGRVIMNEVPRSRCRMIDLGTGDQEDETAALAAELAARTSEDEIALRGGARYVLRAVRSSAAQGTIRAADGSPFRLEAARLGVLDDLNLRPMKRRPPGPGEVEVEVRTAALNFRDVMKALGIYPRESPDNWILGDECAGHVTAVGEGVTDFEVGDRVFVALASHCLASHVTCPAIQVAHLPASLDWEEAVTLPIAFMTAGYALHHLARMAPGERVLIHSAAGGVGLAAVQMALAADCEVFATAGNEEKREFLRALGVQHVMDSHTLGFADDVMALTGGQGVDIVLNSLAGDALSRSMSLLRHNGRFIEIGKRDIFGNGRIGLRPFRTNISFHSLDLIVASQRQPDVMRALWERIVAELEQGTLHTLPTRVFPMNDVREAFRFMMRGEHIGKIVLTLSGQESVVEPFPEPEGLELAGDATYLITGGLGGFGLATARWLAERGARHLVLVGRSGASGEAARRTVEELRRDSVEVSVAKVDVSSEEQVGAMLDEIRRTMPPLRGVIHAAMVLDDGVVLQLDAERFRTATAPKINGAWNLHRQTRGEPLDFFVCYSSVSSVIGNSGQANYAAGNTFLDSLAHYRHALGLPALTVNWGPLKEVGYVARHEGLTETLARMGMAVLEVRPAVTMLGRILQIDRPQLGVIDANWNQWARTLASQCPPTRFAGLVTRSDVDSDRIPDGRTVREAILSAEGAERRQVLESFLSKQAAKVLRTTPSSIDLGKPLHELGLDSLTAVELVHLIEGELGLTVPTAQLMGGQDLATMATKLAESVDGSHGPTSPEPVPADPAVLIEGLSEAEVDVLLREHADTAAAILARAETESP